MVILDKKMEKFVIVIILIALAAGAVYYFYFRSEQEFGSVTIGRKKFSVEIADSDAERILGLSNRENIGPADGMLFVFEQPGRYGFWMKDVKFSLDIIWINDGRVVDFVELAPPVSGVPATTYYPPIEIDRVLELPGGTVRRYNIDKGSPVEIVI